MTVVSSHPLLAIKKHMSSMDSFIYNKKEIIYRSPSRSPDITHLTKLIIKTIVRLNTIVQLNTLFYDIFNE